MDTSKLNLLSGLEEKQKNAVYVATFVRFGAAIFMFINPFLIWIVSVVLDYLDAVYLDQIHKIGREIYELVDKYMDLVVDLVMIAVGLKYGVFFPLMFLIIFRLIGQWKFWTTKKEYYLILFPNIFESYWLWGVALPLVKLPSYLFFITTAWGLVILMLIKFIQEVFVHFIYPKYVYSISMNYIWKPIHKRTGF